MTLHTENLDDRDELFLQYNELLLRVHLNEVAYFDFIMKCE